MIDVVYVLPRECGSERYVKHAFVALCGERSYVRRLLALELRFWEDAHLDSLNLCSSNPPFDNF